MAILLIQSSNRSGWVLPGLPAELGAVECAPSLAAALRLAREGRFEAFVLDLRRARLDAAAAVHDLRQDDEMAAIVVLGPQTSLEQRLQLLESGADDYLAEPFSERELAIRLRVLLRRMARVQQKLCLRDLELDLVRHRATRQGKPIPLTAREFAVLECLLRHAGQPLTRARIFEEVWNNQSRNTSTNIVDVYINYLRAKVDRDFAPKLIHTVYGVGYLLAEKQERSA